MNLLKVVSMDKSATFVETGTIEEKSHTFHRDNRKDAVSGRHYPSRLQLVKI